MGVTGKSYFILVSSKYLSLTHVKININLLKSLSKRLF